MISCEESFVCDPTMEKNASAHILIVSIRLKEFKWAPNFFFKVRGQNHCALTEKQWLLSQYVPALR